MRRVLLVIFALLLVGLLGAGWYAYDRGLTRKWRTFVSSEFRKRGVELSLRQLALVPFRGLVAREVKIYDGRDRHRTLAVIDEVLLVINYANFVKGVPFIEALELREARLAVPLDPKNPRGPGIEISRIRGRLLLPPQQIYLSQLEAEFYGIQLSASGRLINPLAIGRLLGLKSGQRSETTIALTEQVITELKAFEYEKEAPALEIHFSGDLAEPEKIFVEAKLTASGVRRGRCQLESVAVDACYRDGAIELRELGIKDGKGSFAASGHFEPDSRQARLRLRSDLDLLSLAGAFRPGPPLEELIAYGLPHLDLSAEGRLGSDPSLRVSAHLASGKFGYRTALFESFKGDFSWENGSWSGRDLHLVHRTGELKGDVLRVPDSFRARFQSTLNPRVLSPFVHGWPGELLASFDFSQSARIELEANGSAPTLEACSIDADLSFGRMSFRNIPAQGFSGKFHFQSGKLSVEPFEVTRVEGSVNGGLMVDFPAEQVWLKNIRSSVNPAEVMTWIEPKLLQDVAAYRFVRKAPRLQVDGVVDIKRGGEGTRLEIEVDAPTGFDYVFLQKPLSFPRATAKLAFKARSLKISDFEASLFGGKLLGEGEFSLNKSKPGHSVEMRCENVDYAKMAKLYFNAEGAQGHFDAEYKFSGAGLDAKAMHGAGKLQVRDGNIFSIPFLGPVSGILNGIMPGMGHDVTHKASASWNVEKGVIQTEDFAVAGTGFSLTGQGKLMIIDDAMDFSLRINPRGIPGSKLFEYVADEKLSKPKWRAKAIPKL